MGRTEDDRFTLQVILGEERSIFLLADVRVRVIWDKSWNSLGRTRIVKDRVRDNEVRSQDGRWLGQGLGLAGRDS